MKERPGRESTTRTPNPDLIKQLQNEFLRARGLQTQANSDFKVRNNNNRKNTNAPRSNATKNKPGRTRNNSLASKIALDNLVSKTKQAQARVENDGLTRLHQLVMNNLKNKFKNEQNNLVSKTKQAQPRVENEGLKLLRQLVMKNLENN